MTSVSTSLQSKLIGAAFKSLDSAELVKYETLAKQDKRRYASEVENYSPPEDSGNDSDDGKAKSKSKKKAKKDPNAPKGPMNAYMFFSQSVRDEIKAENPDFKMGDIVSNLSFECQIPFNLGYLEVVL